MKPAQNSKGLAEKKPRSSGTPLMSGSATTVNPVQSPAAQSAFGSPSPAVWNRYIDSRMKQFTSR